MNTSNDKIAQEEIALEDYLTNLSIDDNLDNVVTEDGEKVPDTSRSSASTKDKKEKKATTVSLRVALFIKKMNNDSYENQLIVFVAY